MRRVVVTGLGCVTPLGVDVTTTWSGVLGGASGLRRVSFGADGARKVPYGDELPCKVGAPVDAALLSAALSERKAIGNARAQEPGFISMALAAACEAASDAGLEALLASGRLDPARAGVAIGSGIGSSVEEVIEAHTVCSEKGLRRLSPYFVPRLLLNLAAGNVAIRLNLQGPNHSCSTACATGAHSIGDASRLIAFGDADVMVAGGSEATLNALSIAGFSRLKALSTAFNDRPEAASRPFDKARDGFVMGEGAGVVVLEEREHALRRGARVYAELAGYGLSGDAFHLTAPSENGRGAERAMRAALARGAALGGHAAQPVAYVNAHATSTPLGDAVEAEAIARAFGPRARADRVAVSSSKGHIGHLLGAAGAVEAILTILSVHYGIVPPTRNLEDAGELLSSEVDQALLLVRGEPLKREVRVAMSNSFGFGGTNSSLLFSKP
jgi:3-oxoacyl-[acyl-carrier-protein] synthase II